MSDTSVGSGAPLAEVRNELLEDVLDAWPAAAGQASPDRALATRNDLAVAQHVELSEFTWAHVDLESVSKLAQGSLDLRGEPRRVRSRPSGSAVQDLDSHLGRACP